jgi:hypothetical protein
LNDSAKARRPSDNPDEMRTVEIITHAIVIGAGATLHAALRFRPAWFTWMATNWLLFVSTSFVLSVPRYTLTLFPLFISMGLLTRRVEVLVAVSLASIAGLVYFAGRFATGNWAF